MGKWSTYRRKGSTRPGALAYASPPAPTFENEGDHLIQTNTGDMGAGLEILLYSGPDPLGPWGLILSQNWAASFDWGHIDDLDPAWYAVTQTCGPPFMNPESPPSNALLVAV